MEEQVLTIVLGIGALIAGIIVGTIINNAATEDSVLWTAKLFGN